MMEDDDGSTPSSNLFLQGLGEVVLTLDRVRLSWKTLPSDTDDLDTCCLRYKFCSRIETEIQISDVYAVEAFNHDLTQERISRMGGMFFSNDLGPNMHYFIVYGFRRSKAQKCLWNPSSYIFGHNELETCQKWIQKINECLNKEAGRPKNLLVFVHPLSGMGKGCRIWESVQPIFLRANVKTKVIVTQRAGHAYDVTTSMTDAELCSLDGVIAVGGDGFFNEILNALLLSRHKASPVHSPEDVFTVGNGGHVEPCSIHHVVGSSGIVDAREEIEDREDAPLLPNSEENVPCESNTVTGKKAVPCVAGHPSRVSFPNSDFRLGLIPAGSTDSIVISTTGARDAVTSALHIVLGKRICLDIAQIVRWKTCTTSSHPPSVHYAASFAGYGFYGDVIKESEKHRWMGPRRYDYAGTKVFLRHSSYDADVGFVEVANAITSSAGGSIRRGTDSKQVLSVNPLKRICRMNCNICSELRKPVPVSDIDDNASTRILSENSRWLKTKGRFHCVGAAIISCRNERAPDGLVADAHLADGFMHLILIKECPRPFYLWHLTKLTRRGSDPLDFEFVEHHRTPAFTFATSNDQGIWNLDGELFQASQLSARVFRGLVNLFAAGPEV